MILVPPGVRILLAARPVDFRKGMDGLAALVQQVLRADPFAGEVFIFRPRRGDRVKILVYDGTGRGRGPDGDRPRPGSRPHWRRRGRRGAAAGARGGAGPAVIAVPPGVRILLAARPVDFRKGMDGLAALVQQALRADPFAGEVFIFRPKRADRVKILVYDGTGLCLYTKRLEAGRFC